MVYLQAFYVTLDLSSTIGPIRPRKQPNGQSATEVTATTPATPDQSGHTPVATPDPSQAVSTPQLDGKSVEPVDEANQEAPDDSRIQILDLHTPHPIVSFRNHIYDCRWTSNIGTDLLITAPNPDSELPKLVEGKGFDILAASSIKIVGQSAQLVPKPGAAGSRNATSDDLVNQEVDEGVVKIPVGAASSKARRNQARFLERLITVKKAKGELDAVPLHSQKRRMHSGWRMRQHGGRAAEEQAEMENLRRLAADGDEGASKALKEMEAQANESGGEVEHFTVTTRSDRRGTGVKARGPHRKRGQKRRALGGLFRDYRPTDGDEEGADIRSMPITTPQTDDSIPAITGSNEPVIEANVEMRDAPGQKD